MRRNLLVLDILLLALCGLGVWRFNESRRERLAEQTAFLKRREVAIPALVAPMPPKLAPIAAGLYVEVAQKLLLSADRNPTVVLDVVPPKVMPALPRAYGAMDLGEGPRVVLAAAHGNPQRSYAAGETIGEFKLLAITQAGVVFEWDGKQVAASYEQMRDLAPVERAKSAASTPSRAASALAAQPVPAAAAQSVQNIASSASSQGKPGAGSGAYRACQPGDNSPVGTVAEGYRKVSVQTPMGASCHWEKVN